MPIAKPTRSWTLDLCAYLPAIFLLYAIPAIILLSVIMAPFQVADELAHVQRSDQITRGKLISNQLGGTIDGGWVAFGDLYERMWFHPEVKQTVALARQAGTIGWQGRRDHVNFQNTAQYGPALYAPQAAGILIGRWINLSLSRTLLLSRLLNGLAACLIGYFALRICRRGRALMFATLLLPMTLSQFASVSADALLISMSLFGIALVSRVLAEQRPATLIEFTTLVLIVVLTTMFRPPQAVFAVLWLGLVTRSDAALRAKLAISVAGIAVIAVWMKVLSGLTPPIPPELSYARQTWLILENPLRLPTVIMNNFAMQGTWLLKTVVGCLGWLDTLMPNWYYVIAAAALAMALLAPCNEVPTLWPALLALTTFVALFLVVCAALYISWTPVGQATINTMQGRYMLPALPLLGWIVPFYGPRLANLLSPTWWPVVLFPLVTLVVTPWVIMERYYGSWQVMGASLRALLVP
jgi:hypothetical protein